MIPTTANAHEMRPVVLNSRTPGPSRRRFVGTVMATVAAAHQGFFQFSRRLITSAIRGHTVNGHSAGDITRDDVLDNITLYWLTNTGISAARFYWEGRKINPYNAMNIPIPAAVSVFPGENYVAPRSWIERAYPKLIYYNKLDKGGHFAAWEQPQLLSQEVRAGFRRLRM